jgi:hypothetical protein
MPAGIGATLALLYFALVGIFAANFWGGADFGFTMVLVAIFVGALLMTPAIMLSIDPRGSPRPALEKFLANELDTASGHCPGGAALAQIFIVPAMLVICAIAMGIVRVVVS